jgi:hypothetical protein
MNLKELKIGNYVIANEYRYENEKKEVVMDCVKKQVKCNGVFDDGSEDAFIQYGRDEYGLVIVDSNNTEPIPLTEEWLLKLGFKNEHNPIYFSIDGFYIEYKNDEFTTEVGECSYLVLEYVHQLQNLYFALTGEELVINELP